ncbi:MAG TPA: hypothetical protein VND65_14245, partial [Candidatus Binatia bacterium]|nr:hypothetical protein [Candidatus Binatia bacterium]
RGAAALTPTPPRGTLNAMVVLCPLGMVIPEAPVSTHNPVLFVKGSVFPAAVSILPRFHCQDGLGWPVGDVYSRS